jgi:lipopolysaccharide biosynthesis protein
MKQRIIHKTQRVLRSAKRRLSSHSDSAALPNDLPCTYSVDNPVQSKIENKTITVDGWLIPNSSVEVQGLHLRNNNLTRVVPYGLKRADVAKVFPDNPRALHSGFSVETDVSDGLLTIEVDFGDGYVPIHSIEIKYSPEMLVADLYNPDLAANWAEHLNLIENKKQYFYEEPIEDNFKRQKADPRLVAFYLPQFHPIAENDHAWGKGFTEWTNVASDTPRFVGHVQPFLPKDLGFYDLRLEENIASQIELAKKHGIYGFCFYYYWFSSKRLLEKPLDTFLQHKEWNFNFSICWANENWTKRWDGRDSEVIVAQKYDDDDPLRFIKDVERILLDPRYIQEDGKPILTVFRASELKEPERYAKVWREYFLKAHGKELYLVSIISFEDIDPRTYGFDIALDFAPQSSFFKNDCFLDNKYPTVDVSAKLIDKNFSGTAANYRAVALNEKAYEYFGFPSIKCVTPSWDNDARKKGKGFVMHYQSPDIYGEWLRAALVIETKKQENPLVFINAWNEWAEGAVLEPTQHYGHAILNRTTEVLASYSKRGENEFPKYGIKKRPKAETAVVVHLYYPERWTEICKKLDSLNKADYDLYITLSQKDRDFEKQILNYSKNAQILYVPNRGRDVLPFLHLARRLDDAGYKYALKLHSKKSTHRKDGNDWFKSVISGLLPDSKIIPAILMGLRNDNVSIVGPKGHTVSLKRHMGGNEGYLKKLLTDIYGRQTAEKVIKTPEKFNYFGGTMFWIKLETLRPLLKLQLLPEDFESEQGQIDGTLAHAVERLMGVIPQLAGEKLYVISEHDVEEARFAAGDEKYAHAP